MHTNLDENSCAIMLASEKNYIDQYVTHMDNPPHTHTHTHISVQLQGIGKKKKKKFQEMRHDMQEVFKSNRRNGCNFPHEKVHIHTSSCISERKEISSKVSYSDMWDMHT